MSEIKLYNGDCLEVMKQLPTNSVDAVLCDLPYGTTWAKWDKVIDFDLLWKEYNRICKGAVILFSTQPFTTQLINSNLKNYKYTWYWIKNIPSNYLNAKRQPLRQIEEINIFNKHRYYPQKIKSCDKISKRGDASKLTLTNYKNEWKQTQTNYPRNILKFALDTKKFHPTQKPLALVEYLIKTYTEEGSVIIDNCMGSGTTGVACKNLNRNFIGIELDKKYFDIAKERIEKNGSVK